MGENSNISWTDHTWNPWIGCTKVSSGCANCYMFRDLVRFGHDPEVIRKTTLKTFNKPYLWNEMHKGDKVFVCSWSDFFIKEANSFRADAWNIMKACKDLKFQILTKRPEYIPFSLPADGKIPSNVAIGVTIENEHAASRLRSLEEIDAPMKFVSIEPLVAQIDFRAMCKKYSIKPDWVICGGESGPRARHMNPAWARSIKKVFEEMGIKFFMKQMSGYAKHTRDEIPADLVCREFPKGWK